MIDPIHIISLGAGVQSSTMALMAACGEITPMPTCAIFADTGDEPYWVYNWLDKLERMLPFPVHRVMSHHGPLLKNLFRGNHSQIPAFKPGSMGKRQCSNHWKIRPIRKKARSLSHRVIMWIGITTDEISRVKDSGMQWLVNRHPLIELEMSRRHCMKWLSSRSIPSPRKSACFYCPYHSTKEWREIKSDEELWTRVVSVDKMMNERGEFLHSSCKPLPEVDFSTEEDRGQLNLFNNECEGMCGV